MQNTGNDVLGIAKAQKGILWCILANLACLLASSVFPLSSLVVLPFQIYFVYKLASALKVGLPILWMIGMFIPVLSLILLLVLSQRATATIRAAGFRVGLMGAKLSEIQAGSME